MPAPSPLPDLAAIETWLRAGESQRAKEALEARLVSPPEAPEAHNLLGRALAALGDSEGAARAFERCVALDPSHDRAACNLAKLLVDRGDRARAAVELERALARCPDSRRVLRALGLLHLALDQPERAVDHLEAALAIERDERLLAALVEAHDELAYRADRARQFHTAERHLRRAVELRPEEPSYVRRLATVLAGRRRVGEGLALLESCACRSDPSLRSTWLQLRHYLPDWSSDEARRDHEAYGDAVATPLAQPPRPRDARAGRLRVGYFSRDFRRHAVAWFFLPIARTHDRDRVELVLLSDVEVRDEVTEELERLACRFVDVSGQSNEALRTRIRELDLDVLVDLGGHTAFTRLPVFTDRLARLQLSYLGYPDRTGLASYDGRIVDAWSDPPGSDESEREPLLRLDTCAWAFEPGVADVAVHRPPRDHVVFGSYNFLGKLSDPCLRAWAELLARVPRSRLLLKSACFGDEALRAPLYEDLAPLGLPRERLDFAPRTPTRRAHLQSYADIDIALDTFPYNGTTTTCEALWAGTPVVALAGDTHVARVGASLLTAAGHPELVARDVASYIGLANELAWHAERRRDLGGSLRRATRSGPLGHGRRLSAALELLYLAKLER